MSAPVDALDLDDIRAKFNSICDLTDSDPRAGLMAASMRYSFDVPALCEEVKRLRAALAEAHAYIACAEGITS